MSDAFRASAFQMKVRKHTIQETFEIGTRRVLPVDAEVCELSWRPMLHSTQRSYLAGYTTKFQTLVHSGKTKATELLLVRLGPEAVWSEIKIQCWFARETCKFNNLTTHQTLYYVPMHRHGTIAGLIAGH